MGVSGYGKWGKHEIRRSPVMLTSHANIQGATAKARILVRNYAAFQSLRQSVVDLTLYAVKPGFNRILFDLSRV